MNGVDLARRLRHLDGGLNMLFMSAYATPEVARDHLAAGDIPLLQKPFRPDGLLRAVRTALDRAPSSRGSVEARAVPST
jgi:FixJ family two-component response regulator